LERRSVFLALTASGAAVVVALLVLVIKVRSAAPEAEIDPSELAQAVSRGKAPAPSPEPSRSRLPSVSPSGAAAGKPELPAARRLTASPRGQAPAAPALPPGAQPADPAAPPPATEPRFSPSAAHSGELQGVMRQATRFFDRGDYENARATAIQVLQQQPDQHATERMLRIAASSSCYMGEPDQARVYYERLTPRGQRDIAKRCSRYGIEF
jgi:hypothetical protein